MKQCIHGTKAYCIWCWKLEKEKLVRDDTGRLLTLKEFNLDKVEAGTTNN